jgi:hypothetical protein
MYGVLRIVSRWNNLAVTNCAEMQAPDDDRGGSLRNLGSKSV